MLTWKKLITAPLSTLISQYRTHCWPVTRQLPIFRYFYKCSNFSDIPTNAAIWARKYSNFADVPRFVAFHTPTRKENEATYHFSLRTNFLNSKQIHVLPIKQTWKIFKTHFQNISAWAGTRRLGIARVGVYIHN